MVVACRRHMVVSCCESCQTATWRPQCSDEHAICCKKYSVKATKNLNTLEGDRDRIVLL